MDPAPSWLLLTWTGGAATAVAAVTGSLLGGRAPTPWSLLPQPRSVTTALAATILAGVLIYPAIYGVIFELLGRADLHSGIAAGLPHGLLAAAAARPRRNPGAAARIATIHLAWAITFGFLYVTPGPA
jgi:hypothetical protein